jgi:hypothetical protein
MNFDELARCPIPILFDNMLVGLESVLEMVLREKPSIYLLGLQICLRVCGENDECELFGVHKSENYD